MPWSVDANGDAVWVEAPAAADPAAAPAGPAPTGAKVSLVNPAGGIEDVDAAGVDAALSTGRYKLASADEVQKWDTRKEREGAVETLKTFGEAASASAFDALMAPVAALDAISSPERFKGPGTPSGREALKVLVGGVTEEGQKTYDDAAKGRAEQHALAALLGNVTGSVVGGLPLGGVAGTGAKALGLGRAATATAVGAAEGAVQNVSSAREEAYIENHELTGESLLAAMGWGALIGGGVGFSVGKAGQLFNREASRGATAFDSPRVPGAGADAAAAPLPRPVTDLDRVAERGLENADHLKTGMREESLAKVREEFASGAPIRPVNVTVYPDGKVALADGRHRLAVAGELGLDELPAKITRMANDGSVVSEATGTVPLKARPPAALDTAAAFDVASLPEVTLPGAGAAAKPAGQRFADRLHRFAEERTAKALGARGTDIRRLGKTAEKAEAEMRRMTRDVLDGELADGTKIFRATQSQDELVANLSRAKDEAGAALGSFREKVGAYIDNSARELRPSTKAIAERLERELVAPLEASPVPQLASRANDVRGVIDGLQALGDDVSLERLTQVRKDLASVVYPKPVGPGLPPLPPNSVAELQRAERIIEEHIEATIDKAATKMGGNNVARYGELKAKFRSYREASQIAGKADLQDLGNRVVSPSDYLAGATVFAADAASGGMMSAAKAAAATALHKGIREHSSAVMAVLAERLAATVERKTTKALNGFFDRALTGTAKARPLNDNSRRALNVAPLSRVATPLTLFMGKDTDKQKAYQARVKDIIAANGDYGARVRYRTEAALGDLPQKAPKVAAAMATAATRGAQFLESKIPQPIVASGTTTPNRAPHVSDFEIQKFARYWAAVSNPVHVLEDFRRGRITPEQVEALRVVYPEFYQRIRLKTVDRLRDLEAKGTFVPYHARLQLDVMLDLGGAAEPTATRDFVQRFAALAAARPDGGKAAQPTPPARPVNISSRLRSGRDAFDPAGKS
jgi:hypothetical protein